MVTAACLLAAGGCGERPNVNSEMSALENTFGRGATGGVDQAEVAPYVNAAATAVRGDDLAGGVVALQAVQQAPGLNAQQLRAVHDTMQAITAQLVERAAKGDPGAKAQLSTIERTRSQ